MTSYFYEFNEIGVDLLYRLALAVVPMFEQHQKGTIKVGVRRQGAVHDPGRVRRRVAAKYQKHRTALAQIVLVHKVTLQDRTYVELYSTGPY